MSVTALIGENYTYQTGDAGNIILRTNSGNTMTDTLPLPDSVNFPNGYSVTIKCGEVEGGLLQVNATAPSSIDGQSSITFSGYSAMTFNSDGSNWWLT